MKFSLFIVSALAVPTLALAAPAQNFAGAWGMDHGPNGLGPDFQIIERPNDTLEISLPDFIGPDDKRKIVLARADANTFKSLPGQFAQADLKLLRPGSVHLRIRKTDNQGVIRFDSELARR
jgi:hypothetical protein